MKESGRKFLYIVVVISVSLILLKLINIVNPPKQQAVIIGSVFYYNFNVPGVLRETSSPSLSPSPYWWLNSGGLLYIDQGIGRTIRGDLSKLSLWRITYSKSNPRDTDYGYRPQNIFRLFTKKKWQSIRQEAHFRVVADNLSESYNRNESNGLLFINRFMEPGGDLYYTGIRVDGNAVIKKKIDERYYTLDLKKVIEGSYDRDINPNLLPKSRWIGLRSEIRNMDDGVVQIKLYIDLEGDENWELIAEAIDHLSKNGGKVLYQSGLAGIRTDFMDVEFKDYMITEI